MEEDEKALRAYLEDAGIIISSAERPLLSIDEILEKLETYRDLVLDYLAEHSPVYHASLVHDHVLSRVDITIDGLRHYTMLPVPWGAFDFIDEPNAGDGDCSGVNDDLISDFSSSEATATTGDQSLLERLSVVPQPILVD
jgi:hypothetical protein